MTDMPTRDELIAKLRSADALNAALVKAARAGKNYDAEVRAIDELREYIGANANYISLLVDALLDDNRRLRELLTALVSDDAAKERAKPPLFIGDGRAGLYDNGLGESCVYCDGTGDTADNFVHAPDCPILLGQQHLGITREAE
jgi:hypothetical protein